MKICIISFDSTYFDHNIIIELKKRNIEANHIDASKFKYKYKSVFNKLSNSINKLFFNKNIKTIALEQHILQELKNLGHQDIILFIRPDRISKKAHLEIKKLTNRYISYIYDSCRRFPIDHLLDGVFDEIFSFDLIDVEKHQFTFISNYIYMDKREIKAENEINNNIFIVISIDERFDFLNKLANYLTDHHIDFKFIAVGKKKPENINENIIFSKKTLLPEELQNDLENSKIFLDLIRKDHNGLSFRIFEALAMQRKIITTNKSISQYDFYNPNNILILDENSGINIPTDFLTTPYEPLSDDIYYKYTIENWAKTVFKL
jgi:cytochrome oxidase Cu insertion factor (SCO1/SenC/PrrC family)